jgi:hypothetical protein
MSNILGSNLSNFLSLEKAIDYDKKRQWIKDTQCYYEYYSKI